MTFLTVLLLAELFIPSGNSVFAETENTIYAQIQRQAVEINQASSPESWLQKNSTLSKFEKSAIKSNLQPNLIMPKASADKAILQLDGVKVDYSKIHEHSISIEGTTVSWQGQPSFFHLARLLSETLVAKKKSKAAAWKWFFATPAEATDASVDDTCIGDWEFALRSPFTVTDSRLGYLGATIIVSTALSFVQPAMKVVTNCKKQAEGLDLLLKELNLGVKDFDCGTSDSGNDRSIEFWIPERDKDNAFKTKSFQLDYSKWLAQEKNGDDEEEKGKKRKGDKIENVYVFGTSELQEVRFLEPNKKTNKYVCKTVKPSDEKFAEFKKYVEPYRKVFEYMGNNDSCGVCKREMMRDVRTPNAPTYFDVVPKNPVKLLKPNTEGPGKSENEDCENC